MNTVSPGGTAPSIWSATLTVLQHNIIAGFLILTTLALLAGTIYFYTQGKKFAYQYRRAINAGILATGFAFLSYCVLLIKFFHGYDLLNEVVNGVATGRQLYVPSHSALLQLPIRHIDWVVTVPLLIVQILSVSMLPRKRINLFIIIGAIAAFIMIYCGYTGSILIDNGHNFTARLIWGLIATVFFIIIYGLLIYAMVKSLPLMKAPVARSYRLAMILLLCVWFVYPILYGVSGIVNSGGWTVAAQISVGVADVLAKVAFGVLVQRVARKLTLEDNKERLAELEARLNENKAN
jgi:bacteriorhodopsin